MKKNIKEINFEKIGIYLTAASLLISFWNSQMKIVRDVADVRERIAKLEVKVEKLEEKK